jgi:hypothetical protein
MEIRSGRLLACAAALLLGSSVLAAPAQAQDDRRWGQGGALDRYESAAGDRDRMRDRLGREAFDQGYRAGRQDERRGGSPGAMGLAWNDSVQGEAYERLERAAAQLRHALVLMQREAASARDERALAQAREALIRTQNAMTWMPRAGRDEERRSGRGGDAGASRGSPG